MFTQTLSLFACHLSSFAKLKCSKQQNALPESNLPPKGHIANCAFKFSNLAEAASLLPLNRQYK